MQTTPRFQNLPPAHEIWTKAGPIESSAFDEMELRKIEERRQAEIGEPGALGLFGFAVGTTVLGFVISGLVAPTAVMGAVPAVLVLAGIAQFVAGLYALAKGNTFTGTFFSSYGAFYALLATFFWMERGALVGATASDGVLLGVSLFCFGYISLVMGIAAMRTNPTYVAILWSLVPAYVLTGVSSVGGPAVIGYIGGWFLFLAAICAFYGATALVINSAHERDVLALGTFGDRDARRAAR
ncbi:MAG TPA: acetate uptake transporter [Candidatus Acidoferrales bacterium]|nr:acetate uptake transporter [Candidatus Acidoferrales bacterium]